MQSKHGTGGRVMGNLVDRQVAIDEIARFIGYIDEDMIERIQLRLRKLPSAEPEIIYCKDCDQYNPEAQFCDLLQFNFLPEGHCSWGRRKGRK